MARYYIFRNTAFGDSLLAAKLVAILRGQGVDAVFWDKRDWMRELVDVPVWDPREPRRGWRFTYTPEKIWDGRPIITKALQNFAAWSGVENLQPTRINVPVKYFDEPDIGPTDVAICSTTGPWTPYRNWPHFPELKSLLDVAGIRWMDISELRNNRCLNQVKKSRLYLGLDTGTSHLVSSVATKALIIQSGFTNIEYWSSYDYEIIWRDVPCRNCFLLEKCPHEHRCMREISATEVLERMKTILGKT